MTGLSKVTAAYLASTMCKESLWRSLSHGIEISESLDDGEHRSIEESIDKGLVDNPGEPSSNTEDAIVLVNRTSSDPHHKSTHETGKSRLQTYPFIYERPKLAALAWVDCLALWSRGGAQLLGQVSVREILVFNIDFPSESSDVKFRALQWFTTEIMSALAATWNLLPRAPDAWHWFLLCLATAGILIGFDASGHVAEETKNAAVTAARGILWSTISSGIGGFQGSLL
ncbi:hypothetical protein EAE99_005463 [Botrytis elliptica]|nr:hypothetical protein EAE99_005463 [Botrytis elliptica]